MKSLFRMTPHIKIYEYWNLNYDLGCSEIYNCRFKVVDEVCVTNLCRDFIL